MSKARQLYELQEVDLDLDAKKEALSHVEQRLGQSNALDEARATLAAAKERVQELQRAQREGERVIEDFRTKVAALETKLYDGSIRNPKELASIQEQTQHFKKRSREEEDIVLDIMTEAEAAEADLSATATEVESLETSWHEEQAALSKEREQLVAAISDLEQRREGLSSRVDSASLRLYEELRAKRQGRAVAKVEQGMCQGCRIVLPTRELQRARGSQELVQCGSCERILYVS